MLERVDTQEHLRLGWRILLTMLLLACIALLGLVAASRNRVEAAPLQAPEHNPSQRPLSQSSGDLLVLAFYYTWFDENTWTYDKLSDLPAEPYTSRDRAAMGRHIEQAKAAGIDAFIVAWYGPSGQFNQTEANLSALLEEAAARNFKIGILFETDSPFLGSVDAVSGALQHAQNVHAQHPAYLRVDGRPVTFFWRPQIYGVDTWRAIRGQVDPGYGNVWISEGVDMSYLSVFDGHHLYSNTWNPPNDLGYTNQKFAGYVAAARQAQGVHKFWVATVMPGYNDLRVRPGGGFAQDREGGGYYSRAWQAAIDSRPNWIVITSFNEWPEGTYIEPSASYGDQYIGLTAHWSAQFKAGGQNAPQPADLPIQPQPEAPIAPAQPQQTASTPETPTAYVDAGLLNVRSGPGTDYEVMTIVAAGTTLPIRGRLADDPEWWQVEFAGQLGWVYAPLVTALGPLEQIEPVDAAESGQEETGSQSVPPGNPGGRGLPITAETNTIGNVPIRAGFP